MKKVDDNSKKAKEKIKVVITNLPTKEQADERTKKLSECLGRMWNNAHMLSSK